jgi:GNAT superfamily N-acetyltransferase
MIAPGSIRYEQLLEQGYRFDHLDMGRFRDELCKLHAVLTRSFCGFLGFTNIPCDEFGRLFATTRPAVDPRLFVFVYDEKGNLAGFAGAFRDLSDGIRAMRGEDTFVARLRFRWAQPHAGRIIFYLGGITVDEARRGSGLGRAGLYYVIRQMLDAGYEMLLFALQAQGSPVRALLRGNAAQAQRQYTLYELNV